MTPAKKCGTFHKFLSLQSFIVIFGLIQLIIPIESFSVQSTCDALGDSFIAQEKQTWDKLCAGEEMDFNKTAEYGGKLSPKNGSDWPISRILRPEFIETLLSPPYRKALTWKGIVIKGAWFKQDLNLVNSMFAQSLTIANSRFEGAVNLGFTSFKSNLIIGGCQFEKGLNLHGGIVNGQFKLTHNEMKGRSVFQGLNVNGSMIINNSKLQSLTAANANIGGQVNIFKVELDDLNLQGITVKQSLHLVDTRQNCVPSTNDQKNNSCEKKGLRLSRAQVGGVLYVKKSSFSGDVHMEAMNIGASAQLIGGSHFRRRLLLDRSFIHDRLSLSSANVDGQLSMRGITVGSTLAIRDGAEFKDELLLTSADIGGLVSLSEGSQFHGNVGMEGLNARNSVCLCDDAKFYRTVYLSGATIRGVLELSSGWNFLLSKRREELEKNNKKNGMPSIWLDSLDLRHTITDSFQIQESWKTPLKLDGFVYKHFGSFETSNETAMLQRSKNWFADWLKNTELSPQPYEQVAKVLKDSGKLEKADFVLYAGRKRAHEQKGWYKNVGDLLLWATIGYGYYNFRALMFVAIFIMIGMFLIRYDKVGNNRPLWWCAFFSFDRMLPIINLDKRFSDEGIDTTVVRIYFYFHNIMGYVLAIFIAAGFTGLTK